MGLFKRLHRVTIGRIQAFLASVEDPEIVFPELVKEMEGQLHTATEEEARASAAVKRVRREIAQAGERVEGLGRGARLAIEADDEDTARKAVTAQIDAEATLATGQETLETLQATLDYATSCRKQIQSQLEELRSKKDEIITRSRMAKARKKIQQTVTGTVGSSDSILDAVSRLETQIEATESELEIQAGLVGRATVDPSLEKRLDELGRQAEIDKRLDALRDKNVGRGE